MANEWNVTINGRERQISVVHAESGRDVVRVDGRTVARPLTAEEQERVFAIDGFRYAVRRERDGFTVDAIVEPDPLAPPPEAWASVGAHALGAPDRRLGKLTQYWWIGIVAAVALLMYFALPSYAKEASKRVETMLLDLKDGAGAESSIATTIWARNVRSMDANELSSANERFNGWRRAKNFQYAGGFSKYRIIDAKKVDGAIPTALVTFEVDGAEYRILVPERQPISWAD